MAARHAHHLNRCLVLSLCLHSLFTLVFLQYLSTVAPDPDNPTPVSVTLSAPVLATMAPHLNRRPQPGQPNHVSARAQTTPQPITPSLAAAPLSIADTMRPTPARATPPLPYRVPPNRRPPVKRLSAPAAKTPPTVRQASEPHPTQSRPPVAVKSAASASLLDADHLRPPATGQTTGSPLPQFIYHPKPRYPLVARRRGWQGTVTLTIEMLSDGTIGTIKVATSSGYPALDAAAQKAVRKWRHRPLQRNGMPITRQANLPIHFRLD